MAIQHVALHGAIAQQSTSNLPARPGSKNERAQFCISLEAEGSKGVATGIRNTEKRQGERASDLFRRSGNWALTTSAAFFFSFLFLRYFRSSEIEVTHAGQSRSAGPLTPGSGLCRPRRLHGPIPTSRATRPTGHMHTNPVAALLRRPPCSRLVTMRGAVLSGHDRRMHFRVGREVSHDTGFL